MGVNMRLVNPRKCSLERDKYYEYRTDATYAETYKTIQPRRKTEDFLHAAAVGEKHEKLIEINEGTESASYNLVWCLCDRGMWVRN